MGVPRTKLNGDIVGFQGIVFDITRFANKEDELLAQQLELEKKIAHEKLIEEVASALNSSNYFREIIDDVLKLISLRANVSNLCLWCILPNYKKVMKIHSYVSGTCSVCDPNQHVVDYADVSDIITAIKAQGFFIQKKSVRKTEGLTSQCQNNYVYFFPLMNTGKVRGFMAYCREKEPGDDREVLYLFKTLTSIISSAWERYSKLEALLDAERKQLKAIQMVESNARLASIGVIASGITHEIKQPLTAIKIILDSIGFWNNNNAGLIPKKFIDMLGKITENTDRINEIVHQFRTFWITPNVVEKKCIDINQIIDNALSLTNQQLYSNNIRLSIRKHEEPLWVNGNSIYLEQAVINLVVNSMHALNKSSNVKKRIEISTGVRGKAALIMVKDNGSGISPDVKSKLFKTFYTDEDNFESMGLGLSIVKQFIDFHQGEIFIESKPGHGTSFFIQIPLHSDPQGI
jgi:signal transduction histidine kinase